MDAGDETRIQHISAGVGNLGDCGARMPHLNRNFRVVDYIHPTPKESPSPNGEPT